MRKVKYISIPSKIIKEIAAEVGCTDRTVYGAINFRTDGEQPERIRELALKGRNRLTQDGRINKAIETLEKY